MAKRIHVGASEEDMFDRSRRVDWLDMKNITNSRVLLIGAGALGNEVAKDIVLSGFRKVTIVDMDHVVRSNLNRCLFFRNEDADQGRMKAEVVARGVASMSSDARPRPIVGMIQSQPAELFRKHDIVFGCLDNVEARIHANSHAYWAGRPYIDGGMDGFVGRVMVVKPPEGACLQCGMNRTHARIASLRYSCTGKDVVFHERKLAAEITTTSLISAVMVREALKFASGHPQISLNNAFYYDGRQNISDEIEVPLDPNCPVHQGGRRATGKRKRFKAT